MPDECIFCKIAQGSIPSHRVYEDEATFAFLDVRPLAPGHTLVIPKQHVVRFEDLAPDMAAQMWKTVHRITPAVTSAAGCSSSTIAINNGREAGQEVPHLHVHIVPRKANDGGGPIHALFHERPTVSPDELRALAAKVRDAAAKATLRRRSAPGPTPPSPP